MIFKTMLGWDRPASWEVRRRDTTFRRVRIENMAFLVLIDVWF